MSYSITIFDDKMNILDYMKKTRGFVDCIKKGLIVRSKRNYGNWKLEYNDMYVENREYTADYCGKKFIIWLNISKLK